MPKPEARQAVKAAALQFARVAATFKLAAKLTANRLRILCYHGISQEREHRLSPGTFMTPDTFRARMAFLKKWRANVLSLDEGLRRLREGTLPPRAVVITIDDGFYSSYAHMLPVLEEHGFPATFYLSTYYMEKQTFVFNLMIPYILQEASAQGDGQPMDARQIVDQGVSNLDALGREDLCFSTAKRCGYDADNAKSQRIMTFMTSSEAADMHARGFDVQLHTHRHRFPLDDRRTAEQEIKDNVQILADLGMPSRRHFCYPSGVHATWQAEWLSGLGMESAVTTDFGLATKQDSAFAIPRMCDSEAMSLLEFEAAVSGFSDLAFGARRRFRSTRQ